MGSLVIKDQLIGVADNATDMNNMDGPFSSSRFYALLILP
jgi:hypothetical protein